MCQRDKSSQQADDCRDNAEVDTHRTPPFDMCNQTITEMAGHLTHLKWSVPVSKDGTPDGMFVAGARAMPPPHAFPAKPSSGTGETTRHPVTAIGH
jgi:hypothetical protein